jgi:hypothetical protein
LSGSPIGPLEKSHNGRSASSVACWSTNSFAAPSQCPGVNAAADHHTVVFVEGPDAFQGFNAGVDPGASQLLADRGRNLEGGAVS